MSRASDCSTPAAVSGSGGGTAELGSRQLREGARRRWRAADGAQVGDEDEAFQEFGEGEGEEEPAA